MIEIKIRDWGLTNEEHVEILRKRIIKYILIQRGTLLYSDTWREGEREFSSNFIAKFPWWKFRMKNKTIKYLIENFGVRRFEIIKH